jgi:FkbM family methyltransferase
MKPVIFIAVIVTLVILDRTGVVTLPRRNWLSAVYRGVRDGTMLCVWELRNWGRPSQYIYRADGMELTVRRWTTDRLMVNEVLRKIDYPAPGRGQTILDLGAHIGTFSVLAARAGARVLAFEPDASNFALLKMNLSAYSTVEAVPLAVAGASGRRTLRRQSRFTTSGWSLCEREGDSQCIDCIALPEIWELWHLDHIDLLKVNIEGAEYEIIRALPISLLQNVKRVFI